MRVPVLKGSALFGNDHGRDFKTGESASQSFDTVRYNWLYVSDYLQN